MHCKFCGFANGEDDHRCLRCGRRVGVAIAAPVAYSGANALAVAPTLAANETQDFLPVAEKPVQPRLFNAPPSKVVSFDDLQRHITGKLVAPTKKPARTSPRKLTSHHVSGPVPEQTAMDFVSGASTVQRTLKTDVPAQIYCELPVATPMHRLVASSMDAAMILLGFGLFVGAVELAGGSFGAGKSFWIAIASGLALVSMFYGLIWAIAGRETAGMHWTDLQLINFDGFPVEPRSRAARVASTWLSFCSGGLGLIWAVADEENLTWHDHISKTFPTIREVPRNFVKQRR